MASTVFQAAVVATIIGPISHVLFWMRLDLDSKSHQLLIIANLFVVLKPIALCLRGYPLLEALLLSSIVDVCYAASLLISIGVYRAYLHPLRSYPGPFWARVSFFWKVKHFQSSNFRGFRVIDTLHRRYGDVVRTGPRQISINDPAAYQVIYGGECRRSIHLEHIRKNLQSLSDPSEHHARRKVWEFGLNAKACRSYLPQLNNTTEKLCARLSRLHGQPVVINDMCHWTTFDIMGAIGFGRSYGQLENGKAHPAIAKVENFLKAGVIAIQMLWVVNFLQMIPGLDDPMRELKEWAEQLLEERARRKTLKHSNEENRDLMSYVEESRKVVDAQWPMTDKDVTEDAVTLQIAGSDTTYSVFVNLCHYLANYPDLQEKIRAEILYTFSKTEEPEPEWSQLASPRNCPYLDATINEVLRRHPPVPQGTLRETPSYTMNIAGHVVPPNTILSCPIWTLHYDERCFKHADKFIPERWFDKEHSQSRAELLVDKRGFVPFSVGPMNCAGKYFAYMEIKVFVAHILRQFLVVFPENEESRRLGKEQLQEARDGKLLEGSRDYLTSWAADVEVCFLPLKQ